MKKPIEKRPEEPVDIGELEDLRFEDVVFRHRTATENAIDHISFKARLGDTIAFVGPSGSGKTTLVKLLVGLYTPISGTIYRWHSRQRASLQPGPPADRFCDAGPTAVFGYHPRESVVRQAGCHRRGNVRCAAKGLRYAADGALREGFGHTLGRERASSIRWGASAAVDCPRPVARPSAVYLRRGDFGARFDHRTGGHDGCSQNFGQQRTHGDSDRPPAEHLFHADTIHVLEKGRITESGTHDSLLEKKGLYYAMWRQQIGERDSKQLRTVDGNPLGELRTVPSLT